MSKLQGPVRFYNNERRANILLKQFQFGTEEKIGEYNSIHNRLDFAPGKPLKWVMNRQTKRGNISATKPLQIVDWSFTSKRSHIKNYRTQSSEFDDLCDTGKLFCFRNFDGNRFPGLQYKISESKVGRI